MSNNQHDGFEWVKADTDVAVRILEQIVDVFDREDPDIATQMSVISQLLLITWANLCPHCRQRVMELLRERLRHIAVEAAGLAAEADRSPACH